ncbi:MAG: acetyltransferase family protein [Firmicutes bacterium]|nr:acetyltransferase family protein [Bacillota bacterium]
MEGISITTYQSEYKDEIIDLILGIQCKEFGIPITREDQPDLGDIPKVYQTGAGNFWVAACGGNVVGTVALFDIGNHQAAMRKFFINPSYRGSRYNTAKELITALTTWAAGHDIAEIFLGTTAQFLAAHRFYEKNGFTEITKPDLPAAFPVMKVDTKFYYYQLPVGQ